MAKIIELEKILYEIAPKKCALDWDNVGLLVGDKNAEVTKVLVALDICEAVVDEAINKHCEMIITHHPIMYNGIKSLTYEVPQNRCIAKMIKHDIAHFAMHTNLDTCVGGLNDYVSELLNLKYTTPLVANNKMYKIDIYVPVLDAELVRQAMEKAGAGKTQNYINCSYASSGVGSFMPINEACPYIGEIGKQTFVKEIKVEMEVSIAKLDCVIKAMLRAHPYEQPTYNVIPMEKSDDFGMGRIGQLEEPVSLIDFCKVIKQKLNLNSFRVVGEPNKLIKTVAICTGGGGDLYHTAILKGADAYITGDVKHNVFVEAQDQKTALIDATHCFTEVGSKNIIAKSLQLSLDKLQCKIDVFISEDEKFPWDFI